MIRLIVFDLDGTLVESHTTVLLPGVSHFFHSIFRKPCLPDTPRPAIAIATNQGGVGMRYWMEQNHFGDPRSYPTEAEITQRLSWLVSELSGEQNIRAYVCFRYKDRAGKGSPVPPENSADPRWSMEWRKPAPGMLLQAMQDAGVPPEETLFVGNGSADEGAARAAGCAFAWASDFFARNWEDCETMVEIIQ